MKRLLVCTYLIVSFFSLSLTLSGKRKIQNNPREDKVIEAVFGSEQTYQGIPREAAAAKSEPKEEEQEDTHKFIEQWERSPKGSSLKEIIEGAALLPAQAAVSSINWEPVGAGIIIDNDPTRFNSNGRATRVTMAFDYTQDITTMYLGTMGAGLWKYHLGMNKWVPISRSLEGSPAVGGFWVDPRNANNILIGTGDPWRYAGSGMYRTTNGGQTWTNVPLDTVPGSFYRIAGDIIKPDHLFAACRDGLYRSTNGGTSWTLIYTPEVTDVVQDLRNTSRWYLGVPGTGVKVLDVSTNLPPANAGVFTQIDPRNGNSVSVDRVSLAVSVSQPNYVYALATSGISRTQLGGIFRSSDSGMTWQNIKPVNVTLGAGNNLVFNNDDLSWGQALHTHAIAVDPTSPDRLLVGMGGFQKSTNATAANVNWIVGIEIGHADCTSFFITPGGVHALATNDGGIYGYNIITDQISWTVNVLPDLNLQQVVQGYGAVAAPRRVLEQFVNPTGGEDYSIFPDDRFMIAGLQDNGTVKLNVLSPVINMVVGGDGGQMGLSNHVPNIWAFSHGNGASFNRFISLNRGLTKTGIDCQLGAEAPPQSLVFKGNTLFSHSGRQVFFKPYNTTNCDWTAANSNLLPSGVRIKQVDVPPQTGNSFVIYATANGKERLWVMDTTVHGNLGQMTWSDRTPPLPQDSSNNDAYVYAEKERSGTGNVVYYTTGTSRPSRAFVSMDRGVTWSDVTGNLSQLIPNATFKELIHNPRGDFQQMFLATDVGIFATSNFGQTWSRFMAGLPAVVDVQGIEIVDQGIQTNNNIFSKFYMYIGTRGAGFWRYRL